MSHLMEMQGQERGWGVSHRSRPGTRFPLLTLSSSRCPTAVSLGWCPGPFVCFSVCLHPSVFHFPILLSFFHGPTPFCLSLLLISQAAKLPMSIIIIGVGQAEFDGKSPSPVVSPEALGPWE